MTVTLHLLAADGATHDLPVPLPPVGSGTNWWDRPADRSNTGYQNWPGYTGSLQTGAPGSTKQVSGTTYSGFDITCNSIYRIGSASAPVDNVIFEGCRFHGADYGNALTVLHANRIEFHYCTWEPTAWVDAETAKTLPKEQTYEYAVEGAGAYGSFVTSLVLDHCDMWGWSNPVDVKIAEAGGALLVDTCFLHDGCATDSSAHVDGVGFLNDVAGDGISNAVVRNSTIEYSADLNGANGIAMQGAGTTTTFNNNSYVGNYFGGFGFTLAFGRHAVGTTFTDNVFSTEATCKWGAMYASDAFAAGNGGVWARNRWHSKDPATGGDLGWGSAANDGKFWIPTPGVTPSGSPPCPAHSDGLFVSSSDWVMT